jgi:hypothetical protein
MSHTIILDGKTAIIDDGEWSGDEDLVAKAYDVMNPEWEYEIGGQSDLVIAARVAAELGADIGVSKEALIKTYGKEKVDYAFATTPDSAHPIGMAIVEKSDERRYTFSVVYKATPSTAQTVKELVLDAHREYITDAELFDAVEKYVESGDRNIYLQHTHTNEYGNRPAGKWTQIVQWPYEVETKVSHPGAVEKAVKVPANSVFMGVKWEDWAWPLVKAGKIRGLSLGGYAQRIPTH